ncbi:MAG TPA: lipoate--protein ligase family protein [Gemmatimonadaceae bacterium]|nr:lipoate--protein ligase family protein [Gemmatimonadaceae bacterium]
MRWLSFVSPPADAAWNMALDEALMRRAARSGQAVLRVYGWTQPTLSLGRNQRARDCYDLEAARVAGVGFVRRPTGGRALLHDREITYSVTLPADSAHAAREAYHFINTVLVDGLRSLGVPAQLSTGSTALLPGVRPCFDVPAEREIAVGARKLVGSAQWRHAGALLQHGSILIHDDQRIANELLRVPGAANPPAAATLAEALGREPTLAEVADALVTALRSRVNADVAPFVMEAQVECDAVAGRALYHDDAWTWRR